MGLALEVIGNRVMQPFQYMYKHLRIYSVESVKGEISHLPITPVEPGNQQVGIISWLVLTLNWVAI